MVLRLALILFAWPWQDSSIVYVDAYYVSERKQSTRQVKHPVRNESFILQATDLIEVGEDSATFFYRRVMCSVCSSHECYPVDIYLYWGRFGEFLGYEMPPGEKLTKVGHAPFVAPEYEKLLRTLKDPFSRIRYFSIDELVAGESSTVLGKQKVDAVSGATNREVGNLVVEGAVFTFHTLWNLVNGRIVRTIQGITTNKITNQELYRFLVRPDAARQVYAMRTLSDRNVTDSTYLSLLMDRIVRGSDEVSALAMSVFPNEKLSAGRQVMLVDSFSRQPYARRAGIVNKLQELPHIAIPVLEALAFELNADDAWMKKSVLQLILKSNATSPVIQRIVDSLPPQRQDVQLLVEKVKKLGTEKN